MGYQKMESKKAGRANGSKEDGSKRNVGAALCLNKQRDMH